MYRPSESLGRKNEDVKHRYACRKLLLSQSTGELHPEAGEYEEIIEKSLRQYGCRECSKEFTQVSQLIHHEATCCRTTILYTCSCGFRSPRAHQTRLHQRKAQHSAIPYRKEEVANKNHWRRVWEAKRRTRMGELYREKAPFKDVELEKFGGDVDRLLEWERTLVEFIGV